jgi:hypothetical protein
VKDAESGLAAPTQRAGNSRFHSGATTDPSLGLPLAGSGASAAAFRAAGILGALGLLIAAFVWLTTAPAWGAYAHTTVTGEYGKEGPAATGIGNGCRIGWHAATERLYLYSDTKIYGLQRTGVGTVAPLGGGFPVALPGISSTCGDRDMGVDNSATGSAGNIFLTPSNTNIYGYSSAGAALAAPWPVNVGGETCGVAVGNNGDVFGGNYGGSSIKQYSSAGSLLATIPFGQNLCKLEVDPTNNDLFGSGYGSQQLFKLTAASSYATKVTLTSAGTNNPGLAVNGAQNRIYVASGTTVRAHDTDSGSLVETITPGGNVSDVAVDEATDTIFVTTGSGASGIIKEIIGTLVPDVTTGDPIGNTEVSGSVHESGGGPITECYFEYGTSLSYGNKEDCVPAPPYGAPEQAVTANLTGLTGEIPYNYRLVAHNANGKNVGSNKTITRHYVEELQTDEAENVARKSATLKAHFKGNGEETTYHFVWGKVPTFGNSTTMQSTGPVNGPTSIDFDLTGLDLETTYQYYVVASNSQGTSQGATKTFTTKPAVAGLDTTPATDISQETVTLNGSFEGNGESTSYYFEYGPTTAYGMTSEEAPGSGAGSPVGPTTVSSDISEFEGYTEYHYRIVASNSFGETRGPDETFTTLPAPLPEVDGATATQVKPTSAILSAEINPNRWPTIYLFEWGPTTGYGTATELGDIIAGLDNSSHPVSVEAAGLTPGTVYHYRAVAINLTGVTNGPDQTFTTPDSPSIESSSASAVGQTTAHLSALVSAQASPTSVRFDYGPTSAYGSSTGSSSIGSDLLAHEAGADLSGLSPGTTYHFRAVATNGIGTSYGPHLTFTTQAAPSTTPPPRKRARKCPRGKVKRKGKCVKKKRKRRNSNRRQGRRNG